METNEKIVFVKTLSDFLQFEGFKTLAAYEGVRAIELAHKQSPDLILLDIKMPAGDGKTILQILRTRRDTQKIPVIVLTGQSSSQLEQEIISAGAQEFLSKPYDPENLLSKIRGASLPLLVTN